MVSTPPAPKLFNSIYYSSYEYFNHLFCYHAFAGVFVCQSLIEFERRNRQRYWANGETEPESDVPMVPADAPAEESGTQSDVPVVPE